MNTPPTFPVSERRRGGIVGYVISAVLILGGLIIAIGPAVVMLVSRPHATQFLAPGTQLVKVDVPGSYTLWNDYQTEFEGKIYQTSSDSLPEGIVIQLMKKADGSKVEFDLNRTTHMSSGSCASISVADFKVSSPGEYEISVGYPSGQPLVFSFGKDWILQFILKLLLCGLAGAVLVAFGITLGIATFIKRRRK